MASGHPTRRYGVVFDEIAAEYDRRRWTYPDGLVDHACRLAGLELGDPVLEVACGTGQLTRSLADRGLRITALDRGGNLLGLARQNLSGYGDVEFVHGQFEEAELPAEGFKAMFSASAWHWLDPDISWRRAASLLADGGTLALIQYFGLADDYGASDEHELVAALGRVAPELYADWPQPRDLDTLLAGVEERRHNISDVWAWLGRYDVARTEAADLFGEVEVATTPVRIEQTADEVIALWRTMSSSQRMSQEQRDALERETRELERRLGRPIRSSIVTVLVTAARR